MVRESDQNVFLNQIDDSSFAEFEITEYEISRVDCILYGALAHILQDIGEYMPVENQDVEWENQVFRISHREDHSCYVKREITVTGSKKV